MFKKCASFSLVLGVCGNLTYSSVSGVGRVSEGNVSPATSESLVKGSRNLDSEDTRKLLSDSFFATKKLFQKFGYDFYLGWVNNASKEFGYSSAKVDNVYGHLKNLDDNWLSIALVSFLLLRYVIGGGTAFYKIFNGKSRLDTVAALVSVPSPVLSSALGVVKSLYNGEGMGQKVRRAILSLIFGYPAASEDVSGDKGKKDNLLSSKTEDINNKKNGKVSGGKESKDNLLTNETEDISSKKNGNMSGNKEIDTGNASVNA